MIKEINWTPAHHLRVEDFTRVKQHIDCILWCDNWRDVDLEAGYIRSFVWELDSFSFISPYERMEFLTYLEDICEEAHHRMNGTGRGKNDTAEQE